MNITTAGTYSTSRYLYNQLLGAVSDTLSESAKQQSQANTTSPSISSRLASATPNTQSLTTQLSGLVRLVRYAMDSMGLESDSRVTFSKLKDYCDQVEERFSNAVKDGLANAAVDPKSLTYVLTEDGSIVANSSSKLNQALASLALQSEEAGDSVQSALDEAGISPTYPFTFSLDADGVPTAIGASSSLQSLLDEKSVTFSVLAGNMASLQIDPNIDFTIKIGEDDSISVNASDAKYNSVLQAFFEENPSIVADYKRTEALSQIESARKFMALSPSDMKTRLQIESIAAWWDTSSKDSSSWFSSYANGSFSRMSGVNLTI